LNNHQLMTNSISGLKLEFGRSQILQSACIFNFLTRSTVDMNCFIASILFRIQIRRGSFFYFICIRFLIIRAKFYFSIIKCSILYIALSIFNTRNELSKNSQSTLFFVKVMGQKEVYQLLCILDFNNVRKRMSVVVQRHDEIKLYCKGADNVIYERLKEGNETLKFKTLEHLNVSIRVPIFIERQCCWRAVFNFKR
jgi:hypothetical protein